jgi:hypothetical protein
MRHGLSKAPGQRGCAEQGVLSKKVANAMLRQEDDRRKT